MLKKLLLLFCAIPLYAVTYQSYSDWCQIGGQYVITGSVNSSTPFQQSYPGCTITVYLSGSGGTLATIYSNSTGSPLSNPFTANSNGSFQFFAGAIVDIQRSGAGIPVPFTIYGVSVVSSAPGGSGSPLTGSVQYNLNGALAGDNNLTWASNLQILAVQGLTNSTAFEVQTGISQFNGPVNINVGLNLNTNTYSGITSATDGSNLRAYQVGQTGSSVGSAGGYVHFTPLTYNPNNLTTPCVDWYGNPVSQPSPLPGETFGPNDIYLWNSYSPFIPTAGLKPPGWPTIPGCGAALPTNFNIGLNTNSYFFALGGLATSNSSFNSIQSYSGGVTAASFTTATFYPKGTVTLCCGTLTNATYLGGYVQVGYSAGPPAAGTIASTNNPLTNGDGVEISTIYYDTILGCLNVYGNSGWSCAGSGGGSGSPGGANTEVQYNNTGNFGGSPDFTFNTNKVMQIGTSGTECTTSPTTTCYIESQNGFATVGTYYNTVNVPNGGANALVLLATNYTQTGSHSGTPPFPTGASVFLPGAMYYDTSSNAELLYNGSAWISLGGGSGTPGGSNTDVQFNSSGSFGGSNNLTWNNTTHVLNVVHSSGDGGGYMSADVGFESPNTSYSTIQAPAGGVNALTLFASNYIQSGQATTTPAFPGGVSIFLPGAMYFNTTSGCEEIYNGSTWVCLSSGGGGTPGGLSGTVQFNNAGAFAGSNNLTWNNITNVLTLSTGGCTTPCAYVEAAGGFATTNTSYLAVQALSGAVSGGAVFATNYTQSGSYASGSGVASPPPFPGGASVFLPGAMFYNLSVGCEELYSGSAWSCLGSGGGGGVSSLNSLTGALSIVGTSQEINVAPSGSSITLTTPQAIGTASNVNFAGVTVTSAFVSTGTGSTQTFFNSNGNFVVNGNGVVQSFGGFLVSGITNYNSIQTPGGLALADGGANTGTLTVGGALVVDNNVNGSPGGHFLGGINTGTPGGTHGSTVYIGPNTAGGSFYAYNFTAPGSSGLSCAGIQNGWQGYNLYNNQYYTCNGGVAYYGPTGTASGGYVFSTLPACSTSPSAGQAQVGTLLYCADCKNAQNNSAAFDSNATNGGNGTNVLCEGSSSPTWRVH
jgi:hypothetical protein